MGNNNENNNEQETGAAGSEKLFTQEELNKIIGERLAKVKTEGAADLEEREKALTQRELQLDARAAFSEAGISSDFLDIVKINSKEDIDKAIGVLAGYTKQAAAPEASNPSKWVRATGGTQKPTITPAKDNPAEIRRAMGLR